MGPRVSHVANAIAMLVLLAGAAAPAVAQRVEGRVVSASDSVGIATALVQLLDGAGARVAQVSTAAGGAFRLSAPTPGRYVVAVLRIGQRAWRSAPLDLDAGAVRRVILSVPDDPITLPAITVEAPSACRTSPAEGSLIGALLAEADKALTVTRLAMESGAAGYLVERYERMQTERFATVDSVGMIEGNTAWPIRSAPPESLAIHGWVREDATDTDGRLGRTIYFGPDASVLFSPWFLSTHCFGVSGGVGADTDAVAVTFRPVGGRRADIAGRLIIAHRTLELRRIEWRYVRLGWWVTLEGAGGAMDLERLPSGAYLPSRWWMRGPVAEVNARHEPVKHWGWKERGGRLVPSP